MRLSCTNLKTNLEDLETEVLELENSTTSYVMSYLSKTKIHTRIYPADQIETSLSPKSFQATPYPQNKTAPLQKLCGQHPQDEILNSSLYSKDTDSTIPKENDTTQQYKSILNIHPRRNLKIF